MKKIYLFFILVMTAIVCAMGQENTSGNKIHSPLLKDSSRIYRDNNPVMDPINEYTDLYEDLLNPAKGEKMTFTFQPLKKKKSFHNAPYSKFIIPTALISYGLLTQGSSKLKRIDESTHHEITEHYQNNFPIDNYLQYAPYVAYYGLDLAGFKAKHNLPDRTIVLVTSYLIMSNTVQALKKGFGVERPDHSSKTSFPSGHTATAFLGAHLLFREYKDASPWIALGGYLSAAGVGYLRVRNEKHWVSDVVAGAGVGIMSAEISYLLLPVFHKVFGINSNKKSLVVAPVINTNNYGVGFAYRF